MLQNECTVDGALVKTLHPCKFLDETEKIVLIGGPGTGKTHIATAIGGSGHRPPSPAGTVPLNH